MKYLSLVLTTCLVSFLFPKSVSAAISLEISNIQKGEYSYSLDATLSGITASSECYVQAVITAEGTPHYFGKTWSPKGEWFTYSSSPDKEFIKASFIKIENDQKVSIIFNSDPDDSDYKGPGTYLVKLNRYTGNSTSSAGESNTLPFTISDPTPTAEPTVVATSTPISTSTPTSTITPTPTPTKTPTPTPIATKTPTQTVTPTSTKTPTITSKITPNILASVSAVLGDSTDSASFSAEIYPNQTATSSAEVKIKRRPNYKLSFFLGLGLATISCALLYFRHRKD